ncbi:MAG: glutathione S-transferase family protein [Thermoleophilia bacterium]|nr:glutathione S-transferase family protein [Thermoleophilia bacterium]
MSSLSAQFPRETDQQGSFVRQPSRFLDRVCPHGTTNYSAEAGRYVLYVSYACPWAHRVILTRHLKRLEDVVPMVVVNPYRDERGWGFGDPVGSETEPYEGFRFLAEAYAIADPAYNGRVTVPTMWDLQTRTIVCNESALMMRMLDTGFDAFTDVRLDLRPESQIPELDALEGRIYDAVNDGVYRCGFAGTQEAYDEAVAALFGMLDELDERLVTRRYLMGSAITEADWRLFTTLIRFDPIYVGHFKTNLRRIADYANLGPYLRDLYQQPGIAETVRVDEIKIHYYTTHRQLNPSGVIPAGPVLDWDAPHDRERLV